MLVPIFELFYENKNITKDAAPYVTSLEYTDVEHGEYPMDRTSTSNSTDTEAVDTEIAEDAEEKEKKKEEDV